MNFVCWRSLVEVWDCPTFSGLLQKEATMQFFQLPGTITQRPVHWFQLQDPQENCFQPCEAAGKSDELFHIHCEYTTDPLSSAYSLSVHCASWSQTQQYSHGHWKPSKHILYHWLWACQRIQESRYSLSHYIPLWTGTDQNITLCIVSVIWAMNSEGKMILSPLCMFSYTSFMGAFCGKA